MRCHLYGVFNISVFRLCSGAHHKQNWKTISPDKSVHKYLFVCAILSTTFFSCWWARRFFVGELLPLKCAQTCLVRCTIALIEQYRSITTNSYFENWSARCCLFFLYYLSIDIVPVQISYDHVSISFRVDIGILLVKCHCSNIDFCLCFLPFTCFFFASHFANCCVCCTESRFIHIAHSFSSWLHFLLSLTAFFPV